MRLSVISTVPVACAALMLTGCANSPRAASSRTAGTTPASALATSAAPADIAQQTVAWLHGPGGHALTHLAGTFTSVSAAMQDAAAGDTAAAIKACGRLASAVTSAEAAPAVPDQRSAKWYVRALARYQKGAADCQAGAAADDASIVGDAAAAIDAGNRDLACATSAIKALVGS